jgi:hypothetical protein
MTAAFRSSRRRHLVVLALVTGLLSLVAVPMIQAQRTSAQVDQAATPSADAQAAPPEAWWALGVVGVVFVLFWAHVSVERENTRRQEAILNAVVKMQSNMAKEKIDGELKELTGWLCQIVAKTERPSKSLVGMLMSLVNRKKDSQ